MTYFGFLLRFLLIPILIFLGITFWDHKKNKLDHAFRDGRAVWMGIAIHVLLAVIYTTPWDNYLVATKVWSYNPRLVTGFVIGYVPIEEYTFFVVETILTGLWWWFLARRIAHSTRFDYARLSLTPLSARRLFSLFPCLLASLWLLFTYLFFFGATKWTYLSITLFWALPPIIIQLLFGADILWRYRKLILWIVIVPGTYLSLTDIVALKETTWSISTAQTTGIYFFGVLPLEEVVFFFITNVMITFGMTLLLANISQERFTKIKNRVQMWKERNFNPQAR